MNINKEEVLYYLKKTGLNPNVIEYVKKKFIGIGQMKSIIEDSIKESVGLDKDKVDKNIINQLMKGNENFCITPDGNLWIKKEASQQETQKQDVVKIAGHTFGVPNFGRDATIVSTTDYTFIESRDDEVRERRISINKHDNGEEQYYSGKIDESIYNSRLERLSDKNAQWGKKDEATIPNEELITSIKTHSNFHGQSFVDKFESFMQNFNEWNALMEKPVTLAEKNFQEDIMDETNKRRITIDGVKNFFSRLLNKEREAGRSQ